MSEVLEARAEVIKLARLLHTEPSEIAFAEKAGSDSLREFRDQLVELFYGNDSGVERFAKIGNLLPSSIIASLTKEAVGPVLAARIAGLIEPKNAVAVVSKLSIPFVTDISVELDPRRVEPVIGALPPETLAGICKELIKRKEFVAMGGFVGFVDEDTLASVFKDATDSELLQIGFVTEDTARLAIAISQLSDERLGSIIRAAGHEGYWPEALDLLRNTSDDGYFRLIDIASAQDKRVQDELVAASQRDGLWPIVIPAVAQMTDPSKTIDALLRSDAKVFKGFADAVAADKAWVDAGELIAKLSDQQRAQFRERLAKSERVKAFAPVAELLAAK